MIKFFKLTIFEFNKSRQNYLFLKKNMYKFLPLPFNPVLVRDPKNILYHQYGIEGYADLVLSFSLFDKLILGDVQQCMLSEQQTYIKFSQKIWQILFWDFYKYVSLKMLVLVVFCQESRISQYIKMLVLCPVGPVLPHEEKVPS